MATYAANTYYTTNATDTAWTTWNGNYANITTGTSGTWSYWNQVVTSDSTTSYSYTPPVVAQSEPSAEELRLQEEAARAEREAYERAQAKEKQERKAAQRRARILLLKNLSRQQRKQYQQDRCFTVISADGERTYRIEHGRAQNVRLLAPDGRVLHTYCAHPIENVPNEDTILAQKLMLESCEDEFLRLANVS